MSNPKAAPAARVSAANALLDRGYGKPPQHITGENATVYVARLPEPCKTVDEWVAKCGGVDGLRKAAQLMAELVRRREIYIEISAALQWHGIHQ
jgi:hypothetical protein